MDNTLFIYIVGDNGASAEGGPEGTYNEMMALNGIISTAAINMPHLDEWGGSDAPSRTTPSAGPGRATRRSSGPSRSPRTTAARRNGIVIHWPTRIKAKGEIRPQFTHVTDIAPTVLEAANLPFPKSVERHGAAAVRRHVDGLQLRRPEGRRDAHDAVLRDVRQPRHLPRRLGRGRAPLDSLADGAAAAADRTTSGSSTTSPRTSARPTTWRRRIPRS